MFAKKNLIALAALATLAVSAQAQSSVTLYGNVDAGVAYTKTKVTGADSTSTTGVESSILTDSFFGLKGQEDLGGGLKAIFKLESSINVDTGSTAADNFFGKNAYIGFAGDFGTVKLGNQESLFKTEAGAFDAFGTSAQLAVSKLFIGQDGSWQNTVGYVSPNLSGFTISAQHSAKEGVQKSATAGSYQGGATAMAVNYTAGALGLSAVLGDVRTTDSDVATTSDYRDRAFLLGASYDFSVVKAFAQYGQNKSKLRTGDDSKDTFFQVGAVVPVSQTDSIHAAYGQNKNDDLTPGNTDVKTKQFSLAYHHALSKRTSTYAALAYTDEKTQAPATPDSKTKTTLFAVGVRHAF